MLIGDARLLRLIELISMFKIQWQWANATRRWDLTEMRRPKDSR